MDQQTDGGGPSFQVGRDGDDHDDEDGAKEAVLCDAPVAVGDEVLEIVARDDGYPGAHDLDDDEDREDQDGEP